jgi:phage recombination protein Bet
MTSNSALAVSTDQPFWNQQQLAALAQIGVQNAPPADLAVFLNFAQRTGLDPFARQIYMIGRYTKTGTKWTIQASIDGLRIVAERSGDYAGQTPVEYCGADGSWRDVWTGNEPPVAARVGVLRHGFNAPLYAVAYFDEYVQTDKEGRPTQMWASKPKLMLAKCAEALALRKAFPNDLAGLYTADEMGHPEAKAVLTEQTPQPVDEVIEGEVVDTRTGEVAPAQTEAPASDPQLRAIGAMLGKLGVKDRDARHAYVSEIISRDIFDGKDLTKVEASKVIEYLKPLCDGQATK